MQRSNKERRRRQKFVTRNSEYHFKDRRCVAVRDLNEGNWLLAHDALAKPLSGTIRFGRDGAAYPSLDPPRVGDALFFGDNGGPELITSVIHAIDRPTKDEVRSYPF
jgi:hypothetical protein